MFFATDIANFLACQHIATLNREEVEGRITKTFFADPGAELLRKLGLDHEQKYLNELKARGLKIVEIPTDIPWSDAAAATREAMVQGVDVIYQATFIQAPWAGRADFLLRVETLSDLGAWSYEVVETKLAKSTKARAIIQLCFYSELVAAIQGKVPERMHVVLGGGAQVEEFSVRRYLAYFRRVKREFQTALAAKPVTYPEPVEHCGVCDWATVCDEQWHKDDQLSLVAGITRNQRKALAEREVKSVAQLATLKLPVVPKIERIAPAPLVRIREQARVQVEGRTQNKPVHELIEPIEPSKGLAALPTPSPGDLFLDFEGDPFAFEEGLEYLIGTVTVENGTPTYESIWSFDPKSEKRAFEDFMSKVKRIRERYPDMHIYHYSAYEPTAIKHLAGRHGVCTDEVDELLRAEVFVDLYRVVRQGLRASVESYSIKRMEAFYGFTRTVALRDATSSLQAFEAVLALGDDPEAAQEILKTIADYNRDDCISTWRLREWLETLRDRLEAKLGTGIARPELKSGAPSEDLETKLSEIAVLKEQLTAGLPEEESEWTEEQRARWLLAQLLEWHRREEKSMWWEYYRLCDLSDDELIEDRSALGGLVYLGVIDETKLSFIHRYQFPVQDHAIDRALEVHDPRTKNSAGTLVRIDDINLSVDLKRGKKSDKPHPIALIPNDYVDSKKQVE
ncbi:MAG: TM0106 family RecB-like putative nuclease, partial [Pyrinomonadaceae bacterium]